MKRLLLLIVCLPLAINLFAWGQKGHDVIAYIAECHLTAEAAEQVDRVLDGRSLVYYANWMDIASRTPEYAHTRTWHYLNVDDGESYDSMEKNPNGDTLTAVTMLTAKLREGGLSAEEEADALKMLIHIVGDMHCPLHAGHRSDAGGNQISVAVLDVPTNLHSAWDTAIPEAAAAWSHTEWQNQIDRLSDDEVVLIQAGEPRDWIDETQQLTISIYADTPEGTNIDNAYIYKYTPVVERQLLRGGHRLARLLNEIYR